MIKLAALVVALAGLASNQVPTLAVKIAGGGKEVLGTVVAGKDMVPLVDLAKLLGAQLDIKKTTPTDRVATLTLTPPKPPFDDENDTVIPVDGDTSTWQTVANSENHLRVRDFVRAKDSFNLVGELEVAKNSITVQGQAPRDTMTLNFYVIFKDAAGKTLGRKNMQVNGVSFEGGRYPISINTYREPDRTLPATVGLRFNAAAEERGGGGGG
jgi:hypothetical protein